MGTEVLLQQQDLFAERRNRAPSSLRRQRNFPANGNLTNLDVNRRPLTNNSFFNKRSDRRKSPEAKKPPTDSRRKDDVYGGKVTSPKDQQFTILKRGESYDSLKNKGGNGNPNHKAARSPRNTGSQSPPMEMKQLRLSSPPLSPSSPPSDMYAGSACALSPSPRSLPLPTFFNKKQLNESESACDDSATRDLRRLLRID